MPRGQLGRPVVSTKTGAWGQPEPCPTKEKRNRLLQIDRATEIPPGTHRPMVTPLPVTTAPIRRPPAIRLESSPIISQERRPGLGMARYCSRGSSGVARAPLWSPHSEGPDGFSPKGSFDSLTPFPIPGGIREANSSAAHVCERDVVHRRLPRPRRRRGLRHQEGRFERNQGQLNYH